MSKKAAKAGIIGALFGALAGIFLLAPKGAKENRQDVKDAVVKTKAEAEKRLKQLYSDIGVILKDLKTRSGSLKGKAKEESKDLVAKAENLQIRVKELISNVRDDAADIAGEVEQTLSEGASVLKKLKSVAVSEVKSAAKSAKKR